MTDLSDLKERLAARMVLKPAPEISPFLSRRVPDPLSAEALAAIQALEAERDRLEAVVRQATKKNFELVATHAMLTDELRNSEALNELAALNRQAKYVGPLSYSNWDDGIFLITDGEGEPFADVFAGPAAGHFVSAATNYVRQTLAVMAIRARQAIGSDG